MLLELEESCKDESKDSSLFVASLDSLLSAKQHYFLSHESILGVDFLLFARVHTCVLEKSVEKSLKPNLLAWYNRMLLNEVVIAALKVSFASFSLIAQDLGKSS
jgi:hypothetical protein